MDNERNNTDSEQQTDSERRERAGPDLHGKRTSAALHEMHKKADEILAVLKDR